MIWQQSKCSQAERHPRPVHAVTTIKGGTGLRGSDQIKSMMDGLFCLGKKSKTRASLKQQVR